VLVDVAHLEILEMAAEGFTVAMRTNWLGLDGHILKP